MNKFLKNYTSEVPVNETVHKIETTLIRCGVAGIMKEYSDVNGTVSALTFQLQTFEGKVSIRLPVSVAACQDAFWSDYVSGGKLSDDGNSLRWPANKKKRRQDFRQQADRTAWKIMQD